MLFGDIVYAAGTAPVQETAKAAGKNSVNGNFVLMILMLLAVYLLMYIPNKKRVKAHKELINSIEEGDEVITTSGIKGEVISTGDEFYEIRVDKGVKLTIKKNAIGTLYKKKGTTNL